MEVVGFPDLVQSNFHFLSTMDRDIASQSTKESLDVEEGGKVSFLGEDEEVFLKKNPTLQTLGYATKEKVQSNSKK